MYNLNNLLIKIVEKNYQELQEKSFVIRFVDKENIFGESERRNGHYILSIDNTLKRARRITLKGVIGHELSHIVRDENLSKYNEKKSRILYNKAKVYRISDDTLTDLETIFRGLGRELLAFRRSVIRRGYVNDGYLSVQQIETILNGKS